MKTLNIDKILIIPNKKKKNQNFYDLAINHIIPGAKKRNKLSLDIDKIVYGI